MSETPPSAVPAGRISEAWTELTLLAAEAGVFALLATAACGLVPLERLRMRPGGMRARRRR